MKKQTYNFIDRTGEKHLTNEGYVIEIIEYFDNQNSTIKFVSGLILENKKYSDIRFGRIGNPFHPSVHGVGFLGIGPYRSSIGKLKTTAYKTWASMLRRCYSAGFPTYKGCSVHKEWHNFQVFAKWFEENYREGFSLDKDILLKGNKVYSPETCCFVPQEVNTLYLKRDKLRGEFPIGVSYNRSAKKFSAQITIYKLKNHLGLFDTIEEAFEAYKIAKEYHIKTFANKWRGKIIEPTYEAMMNYKVEITD